jgi:hypothetical protein
MHRTIYMLVLTLFLSQNVHADVYVRQKAVNGMSDGETRISGKKRREDTITHIEGMGSVKSTTVTRLDKGVVWKIDDELKMYEEETIALAAAGKADEDVDLSQISLEGSPESADAPVGNNCDPKVQVLPTKETIAGFSATGYMTSCADGSQSTIWMAPPEGLLKKYDKEVNGFEEDYQEELYKNYSKDQKKLTKQVMGLLGEAGLGMMIGASTEQLPKHVMLRMNQRVPSFEGVMMDNTPISIEEIRDEKADPSIFEIPQGYQKVKGLDQIKSEIQAKKMMESMGMGGSYQMVKGIAADLETQQRMEGTFNEEEAYGHTRGGYQEAPQEYPGSAGYVQDEPFDESGFDASQYAE